MFVRNEFSFFKNFKAVNREASTVLPAASGGQAVKVGDIAKKLRKNGNLGLNDWCCCASVLFLLPEVNWD
jgi:hypothetical protein